MNLVFRSSSMTGAASFLCALSLTLFPIAAGASTYGAHDPFTILLAAHSNPQDLTQASCRTTLSPLLDDQLKIREGILRSDLHRFGILTSGYGFSNNSTLVWHYPYSAEPGQKTLAEKYVECLKSCSFEQLLEITRPGEGRVLSGHPTREMRELALYRGLINKAFSLQSPEDLEIYLNLTSRTERAAVPPALSNEIRQTLMSAVPHPLAGVRKQLPEASILSSEYTPEHPELTVKAMDLITSWSKPRIHRGSPTQDSIFGMGHSTVVTHEETLLKVVEDHTHWEAAESVAKTILSRIRKDDQGGRLFDDLKDAYRKLGLTEEDAYQHTWDLIGLLASRGTSVGEHLLQVSGKLKPLAISLHVISNGAGVLDASRFMKGQNYSYPRNLRVSFDQGNPSVFWMSAYVSRRITQELGNSASATAATYLAHVGYQMKSLLAGRNPTLVFQTDAFAPMNNRIRMDLVYSAAGANFGVLSLKEHPRSTFNLDDALKRMLTGAETLSPLSGYEVYDVWEGPKAESYLRWKRIINPDSPLKTLKP